MAERRAFQLLKAHWGETLFPQLPFRAQVWSQTFHQPKPHAQKNRLNGHEFFGVCQIEFCNHFAIQLFGALYLWNIHGRNVI